MSFSGSFTCQIASSPRAGSSTRTARFSERRAGTSRQTWSIAWAIRALVSAEDMPTIQSTLGAGRDPIEQISVEVVREHPLGVVDRNPAQLVDLVVGPELPLPGLHRPVAHDLVAALVVLVTRLT